MRLDRFSNPAFARGAGAVKETLWLFLSAAAFSSWLPGSGWRVALLRAFGAEIGEGVVLKPRIRVKFPWRLAIRDHCWIGEGVWIDNLAPVRLDGHVCISQGAYLCTGSHDWTAEAFDLMTAPITLEPHVWLGAMSRVAPGVTAREGAVLALGSVATRELAAWTIHAGNPAVAIKRRSRGDASMAAQAAREAGLEKT